MIDFQILIYPPYPMHCKLLLVLFIRNKIKYKCLFKHQKKEIKKTNEGRRKDENEIKLKDTNKEKIGFQKIQK